MNKPTTIKIFDNNGATLDRYTILIGSSVFAMNEEPLSANGFDQYCGEIEDLPNVGKNQKEIPISSLCPEVRQAIELRKESK